MRFESRILLAMMFLLSRPALSQCTDDPGFRDTVKVVCRQVDEFIEGDSIGIDIQVFNDEALGAFSLGFQWTGYYNSISFSSAKLNPALSSLGFIPLVNTQSLANNIIGLGAINLGIGYIAPSSSPTTLYTVYFRFNSGATADRIDIDSTFFPPYGPFVLARQSGGELCPEYTDCGSTDIILGPPELSCEGPYPCGDVDQSKQLNIGDGVYMINYIFGGGPPPDDGSGGDLDCSGRHDLTDVVFLINYIFAGGQKPCLGCYEAPIIDSLTFSPSVVEPGRPMTTMIYATEPTGGTLGYSYDFAGATGTTYSRRVKWIAPPFEGVFPSNVWAFDGCDSTDTSFMIIVERQSPEILEFVARQTKIFPGDSTVVIATASDPNADPLTFTYSAEYGRIVPMDDSAYWVAPEWPGEFSVRALVTDGIQSDTANVSVAASSAPIIHVIQVTPPTLTVGDTASIVVIATGPVGYTLVYDIAVSGGALLNTVENAAEWELPLVPGTYQVYVTVGAGGNTSSQTVSVVVEEPLTTIVGVLTLLGSAAPDSLVVPVYLYSSINDWASRIPYSQATARGDGATANFEFAGLQSGTYLVDAWFDGDGNGQISSGDIFGWYATALFPLGAMIPVTVSPGETEVVNFVIQRF